MGLLNAGEAQPGRGVDDDKVEAELVEPIARLREALVLTYNDAIMMIGGVFVAALFMMSLVRAQAPPRSHRDTDVHALWPTPEIGQAVFSGAPIDRARRSHIFQTAG